MSSFSDRNAVRYAWIGWAALFLATAALILHDGSRSVFPAYRFGAQQWISGQFLYELTGIGGFPYFPQAAILFTPFAVLPPALGEIAWRLVNTGVFALGLWSFTRLAAGQPEKDAFPLATIVSIPLVWDCARNGQATLIMTGFMLLAMVDVVRDLRWRAVLWLALAVAIKPLAIVLVLLVAAIDRSMTWRVLLGMVLLAVFPFLTQHPGYVAEQYRMCFQNMTIAAHVSIVAHGWTTPFRALRVAGLDVPEKVQTAIRLAAAAATLALCFFAKRKCSPARSAITVFSLAALYVILFSPRTESNTYAMLGPVFGVFLAGAFLTGKRMGEGVLLSLMAFFLVASRSIERLLTPGANETWLPPFLAACLGIFVLFRLLRESENVEKNIEPRVIQ
jgi:alpha-1,2-mannosyltransferase